MFVVIKNVTVSSEIMTDTKCKIIWMKVSVQYVSNMVTGCFYRPPRSAAAVVVAEHLRANFENIYCRFPSHITV